MRGEHYGVEEHKNEHGENKGVEGAAAPITPAHTLPVSITKHPMRVRDGKPGKPNPSTKGITVPPAVLAQIGMFVPPMKRKNLLTLHPSAKQYKKVINRSMLRSLFPDQWRRLAAKHANDTDDRWIKQEIDHLYQTHYDTQRRHYSINEQRRRTLARCIRGFVKPTDCPFKNFFSLNPTLEELSETYDPLSKLPLIKLMAIISKNWLNETYKKIVTKHFKRSDTHGFDENKRGPGNTTILFWAALCGQLTDVRLLLTTGYAVNVASANGITPLYAAAQYGHVNVVKVLLASGADINKARTDNGITPLYAAMLGAHYHVVNALLARDADVKIFRTDIEATPLHAAAQHGHYKAVNALLARGADADKARIDNGITPLYAATLGGHYNVVNALLARGADANAARTDNGATPLHAAARYGYVNVVKTLLTSGADANAARTDNGATPLHAAARYGYVNVVKTLLTSGADANAARTDNGVTPLFVAAQHGHVDVVKALLANGADANKARTDNGATPLLVAIERGHADVVRLLEDHPDIRRTLIVGNRR